MIESYEQMSVGVYERIMAVLEDEGLDSNARNLGMVAALTGKTEDELLDEPIEDFRAQIRDAGFVLQYPHPHEVRKTYTLRGVDYIPTLDERHMTAGQFIDWAEYGKQVGKAGRGDMWAELLSVVLVPVGKKYGNGYDIADVQEAIRTELCILDAVALRAFFLTSSARSAMGTLPSLMRACRKMGMPWREQKKVMRTVTGKMRDLASAGGGFRALTQWLKLPEAAGMP